AFLSCLKRSNPDYATADFLLKNHLKLDAFSIGEALNILPSQKPVKKGSAQPSLPDLVIKITDALNTQKSERDAEAARDLQVLQARQQNSAGTSGQSALAQKPKGGFHLFGPKK